MPVLPLTARPASTAPDFVAPNCAPATGPLALDLGPDADMAALGALLERALAIRIGFPAFADGRGFSLARRLRHLGFEGRLRAAGALIPDQRTALRACGFDEVEIAAELHARHGAGAWSAETAPPPFLRRARAAA